MIFIYRIGGYFRGANIPLLEFEGKIFTNLSHYYASALIILNVITCGTYIDRRKMESYSIDSVIRGYHIYKDIWPAPIGEILSCERESFNPSDPYAVATLHGGVVVGHVP